MVLHRIKKKNKRIAAVRLLDKILFGAGEHTVLVAKRTYGYSGNLRVMGDWLAAHGGRKLYLYYEGALPENLAEHVKSQGITHLDRFSFASMKIVLSASALVLDHSILDCYITSPRPHRHIVNLWHGVPIKRIEMAMPHATDVRRKAIERNAMLYDWMAASGVVDQMAIAACFGVHYNRVLPHGLPRYDLLTCDVQDVPDLAAQDASVAAAKGDKRLLLFAPTFRENGDMPCVSLGEELHRLADGLAPMGFTLGLRMHQYDKSLESFAPHPNAVFLSSDEFPEPNIVLRHTDVLVTDFSSIWVDFLYMDRPIWGFAKDREHYLNNERGFLYDFDTIFPGPFFTDVEDLLAELKSYTEAGMPVDHSMQKSLLLPENQEHATERLGRHILSMNQ